MLWPRMEPLVRAYKTSCSKTAQFKMYIKKDPLDLLGKDEKANRENCPKIFLSFFLPVSSRSQHLAIKGKFKSMRVNFREGVECRKN
jgi:hypothetical protein